MPIIENTLTNPQVTQSSLLPSSIFNANKTDYEEPTLFLGQEMGLLDTINVSHPQLVTLHDRLIEMNWKHNEFPFDTCNVQFKTCDKGVYDVMIRTLAWQWEADSIAARTLLPVMAPFISSTALFGLWGEISRNEFLHARTYSHIVKSSFDNPSEVLADILAVKESLQRAHTVSAVLQRAYDVSHRFALGQLSKDDQEVYDAIFLFIVALWCLEAIQFMSSFGVTFAVAETGLFVPIGRAVQKICQDESVIHAVANRKILEIELQTKRGIETYTRLRPIIQTIVDEVVETEFNWNANVLGEGRSLKDVTVGMLNGHTLFHAKDIYNFLGLECKYAFPDKSPMNHLKEWFNINSVKGAPQEEKQGNYLLGGMVNDGHRNVIDITF